MQKAILKMTVQTALKTKTRRIQVMMCANKHEQFKQWALAQGFGGGMTEVIATAIIRRKEIKLCADISYRYRTEEKPLGLVLPGCLIDEFEAWCWARNVSMSSAIRGWIDNIEDIKAYLLRRSSVTDFERYQAYENSIYNGDI